MTWRVKARWMWVARVVTPTTHSLLTVAALTEAGAVTAHAGSGIGARLHAVSTEEVAAMNQVAVRPLWELQLDRTEHGLGMTVCAGGLLMTGCAALRSRAGGAGVSQDKVPSVREPCQGLLGIALEILVTRSARPLIELLLVRMTAQTRVHGRCDRRLATIRQRLVTPRAVFFGPLNVLGMRQR